jgi:hypothetical protein
MRLLDSRERDRRGQQQVAAKLALLVVKVQALLLRIRSVT